MNRKRAIVAALVVMLSGCRPAGEWMSATAAPTRAIVEVVVANQQAASASILSDDGATMKHVRVGEGPHEVAVSPDGRTAVVTVYGAQSPGNELAVIDLFGDSVTRVIDLGSYTRPHGAVFLGGSSQRLVVTSEATSTVVLVDLETGRLEAVPTNARGSHMVAVDATGVRAWTANVLDNSVSEMDLGARRFVRSIDVPTRPEGIAVTPDGEEVWVGSNDTGAVSVIESATGRIAHTLTGATFPYRLAASPDGTRMAVVDAMGHRLWLADVATRRYLGSIPLDSPRGVVIAEDNRTAWVTLAGGLVAQIDLDEMSVVRTLPVQASPDGVGTAVRR